MIRMCSCIGCTEVDGVEDKGAAFVMIGAFSVHAESFHYSALRGVVRSDAGPDALDARGSALLQDGGGGLRGQSLPLMRLVDHVADLRLGVGTSAAQHAAVADQLAGIYCS